MHWDLTDIVDRLARDLAAHEAALREEQAVYGIDSFAELKLHGLLAEWLAASYAVAREVHYPSSRGNKLTHRQRCDLVLAPLGKPVKLDAKPTTLFDPPDQTEPADALWLEVKVAYQFREGGRHHAGYSGQWRTSVVNDLKKMDADEGIHHAGLLLVVFTESVEVFEKDLQLFEDLLVRKEVLAGFRQARSVPILERMGHRFASVAIWPTIAR
jgi:hypothetical protein